MKTKTRTTLIGAGAIVASIATGLALGYRDLGKLRQEEGAQLRRVALYADDATLDRLNQIDGLRAGRAFSIDDYCGAQCRPDSIRWQSCLDACRNYPDSWSDSGENPENR